MDNIKKEYAKESDAVIKQRQRTEELTHKVIGGYVVATDVITKIKSLAAKHSELIDDFEVVKEMNTIASERFEEVLDKMPTTIEIDKLLENLHKLYPDDEDYLARNLKLQSLRKLCVHLDQHTDTIRPKSYEESVESGDMEKRD